MCVCVCVCVHKMFMKLINEFIIITWLLQIIMIIYILKC